MSGVSGVSFKSYVPVKFFATHPQTGEYVPVTKKDNIRKCQSYVIRNLNGTAKNKKNNDFINYFRTFDFDYKRNPIARSVYDRDNAVVHMVTGPDVAYVNGYGKTLGMTKADALDKVGTTKTFEVSYESKRFYENVLNFIRTETRPIRNSQRNPLELQVYFNPTYISQGQNKGKLKGFEFVSANFAPRTPDRVIRDNNNR